MEHGDPLNAHAEGESVVFGCVIADIFKNRRMNHPASHDLQPACVGTDFTAFAAAHDAQNVDFGAGFREWKEAGPESQAGFYVKYFLNKNWSVLTEAYYQDLDNLVVDLDRVSGTFANIGDGTSYGGDIVVNGTIRQGLYATATYSYNDAVIDRKNGRGEVAADFSRKHVATLGLTWEITKRLKVGARYKYLSGRPYDDFIIHPDVLGAGQPLRFSKEITERNVGRNSGYGLLNVRVDYRRSFGPIDVTTFLDVINVLATSSTDSTEFDYRRGIEVEDDSEAEPLIGLRLDYAW